MNKLIYLVLEDGTILEGQSFGFYGDSEGEVVFNTGMTGYPEFLTDPSYRGQILINTYPLIGNYGVPDIKQNSDGIADLVESAHIQVRGIIVSEYCQNPAHWNKQISLSTWLKQEKIPAITGIDTRALTQKLRSKGVMLGRILIKKPASKLKFNDPNLTNLVAEVSPVKVQVYEPVKYSKTVLVYDFGIKNNILRCFLKRGVKVIRVPWNYDLTANEYVFDGVFLSSGPGDPKLVCSVVEPSIHYALSQKIPIFGICLGHQLLSLSIGADTYKLKYGHRAVNQPCIDMKNSRCYITSQNHGFAVRSKTIPKGWELWMENINDGTCEGIRHTQDPFMAVQFHPEANPGPKDTEWLFDEFVALLKK